jgi:hypothetical protein
MTEFGGKRAAETPTGAASGNVLLQAPSLSDGAVTVCPGLSPHEDRNVLLVSLSGSPERRLDAWKRNGQLPRKVAVISTVDTRTAVADGTTAMTAGDTTVATTTISEPSDLTGIGIKMNKCLSSWKDDDCPTEVCFDSVTALLQYVDIERAFRFLHVASRRVESVDALAHYHIDPGAHEGQTLATVRSLFTDVFRYDTESGVWETI